VADARPLLVVGAGLAGATHARVLAEHGHAVHVIDRRSHLAGNCFDAVHASGVRRHVYGPHLFHTNAERVWTFVARFADWLPYEHRLSVALPGGRGFVALPVNRRTVEVVLGLRLPDPAAVEAALARVAVPCVRPRNAAEHLHARLGVVLTDTLFRPYTRTMWGLELEQLDASVVRRVPLRLDDEDRYFPSDRYQGLPREGYTELVRRMLEHPGIRVETGVAFEPSMLDDHAFCFSSAAIDEHFGGDLGPLPYRSIRFHDRLEPSDRILAPTAQVNFADGGAFTRDSDWARLPGHLVRATGQKVVTREEPCDARDNAMERYYPVPDRQGAHAALYRRYAERAAREPRLRFIGRCGTYRYLDMDQVIGQSLVGAERWLAGEPPDAGA
jgi:UDP-galactopyranose mutase